MSNETFLIDSLHLALKRMKKDQEKIQKETSNLRLNPFREGLFVGIAYGIAEVEKVLREHKDRQDGK